MEPLGTVQFWVLGFDFLRAGVLGGGLLRDGGGLDSGLRASGKGMRGFVV